MKKKKHILTFEDEIDFEIIGLCSHHSDYRLVWGINDLIKLKLIKSDEEYCITNRKDEVVSSHSMYTYLDKENRMEYYLIKNKSLGRYLIPEKSAIDYFLFLCDNTTVDIGGFMQQLKQVSSILAVYEFDPMEIPSIDNIAFN